ncbi:MAG TPA: HEAT repeat domain-containing protein [Rhizomicrobium sp.]|jgi:HEAT repeat protein
MPLIRKEPTSAPSPATSDSRGDLKSANTQTRWTAARLLAKDPSSVAALGDALAVETDARVREALFTSLAHIQTADAVGVLLSHLRSPDAAIRAGALDALSSMPQAVESQLPKLLADPDPDVRLLVCEIVRRLPGPVACRYLCDLLARETEVNVCGAAVDALSEVGDDTALPILSDCAARFGAEPFLVFSIKVASSRIVGDGRRRDPKAP